MRINTLPPSSKSIISPILIGRARQFDLIIQSLEESRGHQGTVIQISGEAGIGKSRLVNETKKYATNHGLMILQGNCFEPDHALPYAPFLDLLRTFILTLSPNQISREFGKSTAVMVRLIPELASSLPDILYSPTSDPESEKQRLFQALMQFFIRRLGRIDDQSGLLLIIEDLHWSDETSLEFLEYLIRRIESLPIMLLLTYRSDVTYPSLDKFLGVLNHKRLALEISLQALTARELDALLRAIFELDHPVRAEFLETIYALTEGNPFFTEEILKSLIAAGGFFYTNGIWDNKPIRELDIPRSIQDAVDRRTQQLSQEARRLLTLAAVAGRRFDFGLLKAVTKINEQDLLENIKELVAAQLVVEESADQFAFRHALTREATYTRLLLRERKNYHAVIAETIETIYMDRLDAYIADLSYHFYEAGVWSKAIEYSRQASERAQALYAPREALVYFMRAIEAAQQLEIAPSLNMLRGRGQTYETIGDFEHALADYGNVLKSAEALQDSRAKWQGLIDLGFLWAGRDYQRTGDYFQQALELARHMEDSSNLAHSMNRLGNWHANIGDMSKALSYHQEALDIFQELNDRPGVAETLDLLGMTNQLNGDLVQGTAHYQRAVELFRELDDRRGLVSSLATLALCGPSYMHDPSVSPESLTEAIEMGEQALKIAREIGWRSGEIYALWCLSICLGPQGEYSRGLELAQRALEISEEIEHDQWTIATLCGLGALYLDLLALPQARLHLEKAFTLAQKIGSSVWIGSVTGYLASACVLQNDLSRAEAVLDEAITADTPAQTQMQRLCWCARAELALARGIPESALSIIDHLIASDPNVTPSATIPRLWKLRSESLAALQQPEEADEVLHAAQSTAFKQGARAWLWRIYIAQGKLHQAQGRHPEAEAEFTMARTLITELTTSMEDQTLRGIFLEGAINMVPIPAPIIQRRVEKLEFGGLTPREREVAALIAQGKTNREIAEALVVSERTAESHVTNILLKLGFTSRARIAVWAADKGLGKRAE